MSAILDFVAQVKEENEIVVLDFLCYLCPAYPKKKQSKFSSLCVLSLYLYTISAPTHELLQCGVAF